MEEVPRAEVWKLEKDLFDFVKLCVGVLSEDPLFVVINSYTTGAGAICCGLSF